jgi:PAS domain S-box-containing protein
MSNKNWKWNKSRRMAPDIESMLKAAKKEADKISSQLCASPQEYMGNRARIDRLAAILGDIEAVADSTPNSPIMRSEEYRKIVDSTALVSKADHNGVITYVNEQFCIASGYSQEELIGAPHNIVRHPDSPKELFADLWHTIAKEKQPWVGVVKNRRKSGESYYVDARIVPQTDEDGAILGYVGIRYDVTERFLQKEAIRRERELNQLILDEQTNIVIVATKEEGIISTNKAFFETLPFENLASFKKNHFCICDLFVEIDGVSGDLLSGHFYTAILEKDETIHKVKILDREGAKRTFSVTAKAVKTKDTSSQYFVITLGDITDSENEIEAARKEAFEAHRESYAKSNFLATMSHEIRTPMNGVMGFVELLADTNLSQQQKEYIHIIRNSAKSLLGIINDILDFSKIESGNFTIEIVDFDPVAEIESIVDLFAAKSTEKEIDLCVFVDPSLPSLVMGDPFRIKQILTNLLSNAIKFTPGNGEVCVLVEPNHQDSERVSFTISVSDTGPGMTEETQKIIFSPFMQADNSIGRNFGGTGLGLTICQSLANLMGSEIRVESAVGIGSRFWLTLELDISNKAPHVIVVDVPKHKTVAIYVSDERQTRCLFTLQKYLDSFEFPYIIVKSLSDPQLEEIRTIIMITSGRDTAKEIDEEFLDKHRVISVIPSGARDHNRFSSHATISMPINGSKIYDAIIEGKLKSEKNICMDCEAKSTYDARVLVAEDNNTNQQLAIAMLKRFGITPVIAKNGLVAFDEFRAAIAAREPFDLIFMDIHMPIMNGIEAATEIIAYEKDLQLKHTPIIALTADAIKGKEEEYLRVGMDTFVPKPIEKEKFDEKVEYYLSHRLKKEDKFSGDVLDIKDFETDATPPLSTDESDSIHKKASIVAEELGLDMETALFLVNDFYENWAELSKSLEQGIESKDYEAIRGAAHSLKGAAGSLRLDVIYEISKVIEDKAKSNEEADYVKLFEKLKKEIER